MKRKQGIVIFVLDTSLGKPAPGIPVELQRLTEKMDWEVLARGDTDKAGCIKNLVSEDFTLDAGRYRLVYETSVYFQQMGAVPCFPHIEVEFYLPNNEPIVLPLLISPFAYSTYRGS